MSVRVSDWYKSSKGQEVMLIAGVKGLYRPVLGAHTIEKAEFAEFLTGKEIIFSTGIALNDPDDITAITESCFSHDASALVLNTGPYIKSVPEEAVSFCNENNFPLFTVPWHIRIEELFQSVYHLTSADRNEPSEAKTVFENAIMYPDRHNLYEKKLRELGFSPNWEYCIALIHPIDETGSCSLEPVYDHILEKISSGSRFIVPYISSHNIVVVFANMTTRDAETKLREFSNAFPKDKLILSLGRGTKSIRCINKSYYLAQKILSLKLANSMPEHIISYDELGIYRIIIGLENQDILNQIHEEYLEPLLSCDKACGTDYFSFISAYLKCDGHIKDISEKMYIHKNTVHYKIRKIEDILDCDLSKYEVKMNLMIAVMNYQLKNRE